MPSIPRKEGVPYRKASPGNGYLNSTRTNSSDLLLTIDVDEQLGDTVVNVTIGRIGDELWPAGYTSVAPQDLTMTQSSSMMQSIPTGVVQPMSNSNPVSLSAPATPLPSITGSPTASASSPSMTQGSISLLLVLFRNLFGGR